MSDGLIPPQPGSMDDAAFLESFIELCKEHGVADWAFVVRTVDGESLFLWAAGRHDGENEVSNRERAANLHFDVTTLAHTILTKNIPGATA